MIIAISGPAGSGKTALARILCQDHGFTRVRFAGALKAMLLALPGVEPEHVDGSTETKETPLDALGGRTPRHAMQTLGTQWGRGLMGEDFWLRVWRNAVSELPEDTKIVVDDLRFDNEASMVRALGGVIVELRRVVDGVEIEYSQTHASEKPLARHDATARCHTLRGLKTTAGLLASSQWPDPLPEGASVPLSFLPPVQIEESAPTACSGELYDYLEENDLDVVKHAAKGHEMARFSVGSRVVVLYQKRRKAVFQGKPCAQDETIRALLGADGWEIVG